MNKGITGIRGIFAIFIVAHHLCGFQAGGASGVSFFFILSGFVVALGYWNKIGSSEFSWNDFFLKRLWKVYPLHLLTLSFAVLLSLHYGNFKEIICDLPNAVLLQSWFPIKGIYFSGNSLSWFLSCMVFFYSITPFVIKYIKMASGNHLLITISLMILVLSIISFVIPEKYVHYTVYICPIVRLVDFIIGIVLFRLVVVNDIALNNIHKALNYNNLLGGVVIIIYIAALICYYNIPERFSLSLMWIIPNSMLIVFVYLSNTEQSFLSKILSSRFVQGIGKYSFEIYMVHLLCILYRRLIMNVIGLHYRFIDILVTFILIAISIFFIVKVFNPFVNRIHKVLCHKTQTDLKS